LLQLTFVMLLLLFNSEVTSEIGNDDYPVNRYKRRQSKKY